MDRNVLSKFRIIQRPLHHHFSTTKMTPSEPPLGILAATSRTTCRSTLSGTRAYRWRTDDQVSRHRPITLVAGVPIECTDSPPGPVHAHPSGTEPVRVATGLRPGPSRKV